MRSIDDLLYYVPVFSFLTVLVIGCGTSSDDAPKSVADITKSVKLAIPTDNKIYHAAYPDFGGAEDIVTKNRIDEYETLAGKNITWAYFSNNWTAEKGGIKFPKNDVETINKQGVVPFIRMMPTF